MSHERRKRLARPKTLIVFGVLHLALPVLNYFSFAYTNDIPPILIKSVFQAMAQGTLNIIYAVLLPIPFIVGTGLLLVRKWAWFTFLGYAIVLIAFNLYLLWLNHEWKNVGAATNVIFMMLATFAFIKRDIAPPFLKMYPRGWRGQKRKPIQMPVLVNGEELKTRDFGKTGFYVEWPDCPHQPNDTVSVQFNLEDRAFNLECGVVRVDNTGAGIAFRNLDKEQKRILADSCDNNARKLQKSV